MKILVTLIVALVLGGEVWVPQPPLGLDLHMPVPETNPLSRAMERLRAPAAMTPNWDSPMDVPWLVESAALKAHVILRR
jgi:hypothetical protein